MSGEILKLIGRKIPVRRSLTGQGVPLRATHTSVHLTKLLSMPLGYLLQHPERNELVREPRKIAAGVPATNWYAQIISRLSMDTSGKEPSSLVVWTKGKLTEKYISSCFTNGACFWRGRSWVCLSPAIADYITRRHAIVSGWGQPARAFWKCVISSIPWRENWTVVPRRFNLPLYVGLAWIRRPAKMNATIT